MSSGKKRGELSDDIDVGEGTGAGYIKEIKKKLGVEKKSDLIEIYQRSMKGWF